MRALGGPGLTLVDIGVDMGVDIGVDIGLDMGVDTSADMGNARPRRELGDGSGTIDALAIKCVD